jgi:hypothetical protein
MKEIESGVADRDSIPLSDIYSFCLKYIHERGLSGGIREKELENFLNV